MGLEGVLLTGVWGTGRQANACVGECFRGT